MAYEFIEKYKDKFPSLVKAFKETSFVVKDLCGSSPKFPVKRVAEVINYTPPLILAYLEVLP